MGMMSSRSAPAQLAGRAAFGLFGGMMKRGMPYRWLRAALAVAGMYGGAVWAEGAHSGVLASAADAENRLEVTSSKGFESVDWVLVQPEESSSSRPWELVQVWAEGERFVGLSRPLQGLAREPGEQVSLLAVTRDPPESAGSRLDRPRHGAEVSDGFVPVEGRAPAGAQVLVFVDGVEGARLEVDAAGRFAGNLPLAPGHHQLQVVTGLEGAWRLRPESVTVVSLAPPPAPVVNTPSDGSATNNPTPVFSGTAQPGASVSISIGGREVGSGTVDAEGNWSLTLSSLTEGSYTASVIARAGGETSVATTVIFSVDLTPPDLSFNGTPGTRTRNQSATFSIMSNDAVRGERSLDDSPFVPLTGNRVTLSGLGEGTHVFVVRAWDAAGNMTTIRHEWFIDLTPPVVTILSGPPAWSRELTFFIPVTASEEVVSYHCAINGYSFGCSGTTLEVGVFSEGPQLFEVYAVDLVGLAGPKTTYQWTSDFTPPSKPTLLQPVPDALLNAPAPSISGTAEPGSTVRVLLEGSERCTATTDDSGNWSCQPTAALTTDSYALDLEVRDAAGNVNDEFSPVSFRVDVDVPDTYLDLPDTFEKDGDESVTENSTPQFVFRSNEEGVSFECSVNGESLPCDELARGVRSFNEGRYTLSVRARDEAGNVDETPATATWVRRLYEGGGGGLTGCSSSGAAPLLPLVPLLAFLKRRGSRSSRREVAGGSALLALLTVFQAGSVRAQGVDLQQYKPAPGSRDVLGVYSPEVDRGVRPHAGLSVSYARNPLVLRTTSNGGFAQSIVSDQVTADVLASVSFLNHFELGLALPVTGQWGPAPGSLAVFIPENATGMGLGDLRLVPKAVLPLGENLSLGAAAVVSLPTASSQSFLGMGGVGVQPMLLAQWSDNKQLRVLANVGGRFQPANRVPLLGLSVGNELTYAVGAQWTGSGSKLFVQGSLEGAVALDNAPSSALPLELLAAVGYSLPGGMAVRLGGGPGLTNGYGTPNFRLFAGLSWAPGLSGDKPEALCTGNPDADEDKDGVLNAGDLCPYESGDRGDGCPKDASAEGIKALAQLFKNDSDNDGFADDADACPKEPGVKERRGCAVPVQPAGKEPDSVVATLSFPSKKPDTDSPKNLDTVVTRVQELLKNNHLAEVRVSFPPDQPGAMLMQQRATSVSGALTQRIPELKASDRLKVDFQGKPARRSGGKDVLDIKFTFVRAVAPKDLPPVPELKCAAQGVAARLMSSHGEVTAGAENKLAALANEGTVCDGDLVKTGATAGAVLVLSDGNVLRLAPDSQVKLSRTGVQLLHGTVDSQGAQAALAAPEISSPCGGPASRPTTISWQKVPGARKYWVQVARGADFNSDARFVLTERTGTSLELPEGGKWFWRVLPVDDKGRTGQPSKVHSFEESASVSPRS
ncbi:hypothetical protein F0U59_42155 [Archangium gephyra]|nr:hypothetical protein F0U59_42155 [Archangium gephyra]